MENRTPDIRSEAVRLLSVCWLVFPPLSLAVVDASLPSAAASGTGTALASASPVRKTSPYRPADSPERARTFYQSAWGIDKLLVRETASGNLIRFSYRVTDPVLARPLVNKQATPYLYGERSNAVLQVPIMDKVGELRQTGPQEVGQKYWMVFSNKGNLVKSGDRVDVFIGAFHATGLKVE
jgi:hypothetical protein